MNTVIRTIEIEGDTEHVNKIIARLQRMCEREYLAVVRDVG